LTYPVGLAQDGGGNLYVAAANGVWEYQGPPDNEVPLAVPLTGLQDPAGVDVDGNQDLFVSDLDGNDVVELTPAGTQTTVASGLMYPWAIEVGWVESYAPDNDLAVSVPADMTVNATGPAGAAVTFTATASDADDSAVPAVSCTPASASTFAVGTTTVTCGASDADDVNSPVSGTFTVTVVGAAGQLTQLQQSVTALGPGAAVLDKTLARASKDLQAGASARVCADLTTFEGQVTSQTGHSVPPAVAGQLIASAQQIQAVIGC
jgi:hypothetical protein